MFIERDFLLRLFYIRILKIYCLETLLGIQKLSDNYLLKSS